VSGSKTRTLLLDSEQLAYERGQKRLEEFLAAHAGIVNKLKEAQVQGQMLL